MLQKIRWFAFLLGVLLVVVVAFQNQDSVDLNILFFKGHYPLTLLLLATSAISFALGAVMTAWRIRSRARAKAANTKAIGEHEKEKAAQKAADSADTTPPKQEQSESSASPLEPDAGETKNG